MVRQLGLLPPPFSAFTRVFARYVGEGWGGGSLLLTELRPPTSTPTPNPSPQGGGERTEIAASVCVNRNGN
jgi:hypothetical protein